MLTVLEISHDQVIKLVDDLYIHILLKKSGTTPAGRVCLTGRGRNAFMGVWMGGGGIWYSLFIKNLAHYSSH